MDVGRANGASSDHGPTVVRWLSVYVQMRDILPCDCGPSKRGMQSSAVFRCKGLRWARCLPLVSRLSLSFSLSLPVSTS